MNFTSAYTVIGIIALVSVALAFVTGLSARRKEALTADA